MDTVVFLVSEYWIYLAAALVIGLVTGWISAGAKQ